MFLGDQKIKNVSGKIRVKDITVPYKLRILRNSVELGYKKITSMSYYMKNNFPENYQTITEITEDMLPADISECTNFYACFYQCYKLEKISNCIYSYNITSLESSFFGCRNLKKSPDINTSKNTRFRYMYRDCNLITYVSIIDFSMAIDSELSNLDVFMMFSGCSSLRTITFNNLPIGITEETLRNKCSIPSTVSEIVMNFREEEAS